MSTNTNKKIPNVPNLRFITFSGSWKKCVFYQLADFFKGNGISKSELSLSGNKCILYGELYTTYKKEIIDNVISRTNYQSPNIVFSKTNDVLIPGSGETPEDIATACCVKEDDIAIGGDLNIIRLKNHDGGFISYQLNGVRKNDIASVAQGKSIVHLHNNDLKKLMIWVPNDLIEECKISDFMCLIDKRIDTQNKIIKDLKSYKKLLMDYILRNFDLTSISLTKFINEGYARMIKSSELEPFENQRLYLSTSSIDEDGLLEIESQITYQNKPNRASMVPIENSIWFAKMKNSIKVYRAKKDDFKKYILSTGFYGLLCDETKVNSNWIEEIFKSDYFNYQKDRYSEGSSMSAIKENQLSDIIIKIFNTNQKKIEAECIGLLKHLSDKINLEKKLLNKYNEQKKYLLKNMFI